MPSSWLMIVLTSARYAEQRSIFDQSSICQLARVISCQRWQYFASECVSLSLVPRPTQTIHALIMINGCFYFSTFSWTAIKLWSVSFLQICMSYSCWKMAIIRIWVCNFVFGAMPITEYSCPHGNWWLFWHLCIWLNSNQALSWVFMPWWRLVVVFSLAVLA